MKTNKMKLAALLTLATVGLTQIMPVALADTEGATLTSTTSSGAFTVSADNLALDNRAVTGAVVVLTNDEPVSISDLRGTSAPWTVSLATANLGLLAADVRKVELADPSENNTTDNVIITGAFDGTNVQDGYAYNGTVPAGQITIQVTAVNPNAFPFDMPTFVTVTAPDGTMQTNVAVDGDGLVDEAETFGLIINYDPSTGYEVNDKIGMNVDSYNKNGLAIQSSDVVSAAGSSLVGITAGDDVTTMAAGKTDQVADGTHVTGIWEYTDSLQWTTHKFPMAGGYTSEWTYTYI